MEAYRGNLEGSAKVKFFMVLPNVIVKTRL
jgi:hypothetical protein